MQILKGIGIGLCERRLIGKLCMDERVKLRLDKRQTRIVKRGRRVRLGSCLSPIIFVFTANNLPREHLRVLGTST
jgi:hypothetical protein